MFASENILLNETLCALELQKQNQSQSTKQSSRWAPRDFIFTDRALYIFAEVVAEKGSTVQTANYLNSVYERMDLQLYKAYEPSKPLVYEKDIPKFYKNYTIVIELIIKETQKRRIIACDTVEKAEKFIRLFNLVSAYRLYLYPEKDGHPYINKWVRDYIENAGEMWFDSDILQMSNLHDLLKFGSENDGIQSIVFSGNALHFSQGEDAVTIASEIITQFSGDAFTKITFKDNGMKNSQLSSLYHAFGTKSHLKYLELSGQSLNGDALDYLCSIFKENRKLEKVILTNNQLGIGSNIKEKMTFFLESLLSDLYEAKQLDLSYNMIDDECLYPIIKLLFANQARQPLQLVNLEWNNFSNRGNRTIVVGYSKCYNKKLQCRFGPLPLTQATLKQAVAMNTSVDKFDKKDSLKQQIQTTSNLEQQQDRTIEVVIKRRPANPEVGMKYLPLNFEQRNEIERYRAKISDIVINRHNVCIEDIQQLIYDITNLQVEFPRHLMEPLFLLCNDMLQLAMDTENIYTLELLLDTMCMMNARNIPAEEKYQTLAEEASQIANNLMKAINMDTSQGSDDHMLKLLVSNLLRAKQIGMRGEVIDIATTLKALCTKFLQEMVSQAPKDDEDVEPEVQMYILREEDKRSVYDQKYNDFIGFRTLDQFQLGFSVDLEPNLGLHPFSTDYIKLTNLNIKYTMRNMTESRRILYEDEIYPMINVHTRAAFLLSDGAPDSGKSLQFSNVRDDMMLRYARLLFRYRLNMDELFGPEIESPVWDGTLSKLDGKTIAEAGMPDEYKNILDRNALNYSETPITKPLTKLQNFEIQTCIAINKELIRVQQYSQESKDVEKLYKMIRQWFEKFVYGQGIQVSQDMADEIYMQFYRQLNLKSSGQQSAAIRERSKTVMVMLVLFSHYCQPSEKLLPSILLWLKHLQDERWMERLATQALESVERPTIDKQSGRAYYDWPPSLYEIDAVARDHKVQAHIMWPTGEIQTHSVDETTTIESLLKGSIWTQPYFVKEPESVLYWLFACEDDLSKFPKPIGREKKILKLMYKDEKAQERANEKSEDINKSIQARTQSKRISAVQDHIKAKLLKTGAFDSKQESQQFKFFTLLLRRRIFPSLYHAPNMNFKALSQQQKNFIFSQGRLDYVERDILKKPTLSMENAVLLAALAFKVKFQQKILRSKENTLTVDIIKKSLDYAIPQSMFILQKPEQWEQQIVKSFEQQNMTELSIEEAQDQFLVLLASYEFMFASYFVVTKKLTRAEFRFSATEMANKQMKDKPKQRMRSRFQDSDESESESERSQNQNNSDQDSEPSSGQSADEQREGQQVFEEYFQQLRDEILLICTQTHLMFVESSKRDKVLLKVKYEDLLYLMGKEDTFRVGMILKKKMDKTNMTYDSKIEFTVEGGSARAIAEDILTYCQLHLLEHSLVNHDYCEVIRRNVIDGLFDKSLGEMGELQMKGFNLIIDDDILLGNVNLASTQTKLKQSKTNLGEEGDQSFDEQNEDQDDGGGDEQQLKRALTPQELHEKKVARQLGLQIKFKQANFVVYMRKHPCYTTTVNEQHSRSQTQDQIRPQARQRPKSQITTIQEFSDDDSSESSVEKPSKKKQSVLNQMLSQKTSVNSTLNKAQATTGRGTPVGPPAPTGRGAPGLPPAPTGRGAPGLPPAPAGRGTPRVPAAPPNPRASSAPAPQAPSIKPVQQPLASGIPTAPKPRPIRAPLPSQVSDQPTQNLIQPEPEPAQTINDTASRQSIQEEITKPEVVKQSQSVQSLKPIQNVVVPQEFVPEKQSTKIDSSAFMAQYTQAANDQAEAAKKQEAEKSSFTPRPSGLKFEKMNSQDKKANLGKVMGAFGPPPGEPPGVQNMSSQNQNAFMAALKASEEPAEPEKKEEQKPVAVRPSGLKFEKMGAQDKKANLSKVMGAFGPPP